jgi:hypothetical protein
MSHFTQSRRLGSTGTARIISTAAMGDRFLLFDASPTWLITRVVDCQNARDTLATAREAASTFKTAVTE